MRYAALVTLFLFVPLSAFAATIHVPADEPTIQEGIKAAIYGDTVLVAPGTYVETINFLGKSITVKSSGGPELTVIDGYQSDQVSVAWFNNGENQYSVLEGFTLTNGLSWKGGAVYMNGSSPTVRGNIIEYNKAHVGGAIYGENSFALIENNIIRHNLGDHIAGIYLEGGAPKIRGNHITNNQADYCGGVACNDSAAEIDGNFIAYNKSDLCGGIYCHAADPTVTNNVIVKNIADFGGGIYAVAGSAPVIVNNTICGNWVDSTGGGLYGSDSTLTLMNNIFRDNEADTAGDEIYMASGTASVTCCNVTGGYAGAGNFDAPPAFADAAGDDYHLTWLSPCINRGANTGAPSKDVDGDTRPCMGTVDVGADEFTGTHALEADVFSLSQSAGGIVQFALYGGPDHAGRSYFLLGSVTGTVPGFPLPGGKTLPLNWDVFTALVFKSANTPVMTGFYGVLDGSSAASATLNTYGPLPPVSVGVSLYFAYLLYAPFDFASNPLAVEIVP